MCLHLLYTMWGNSLTPSGKNYSHIHNLLHKKEFDEKSKKKIHELKKGK